MRKPIKKLGLIGTLFLAGANLIGCGSTPKAIDELTALSQRRQKRTLENVYQFNEGLEKLQEKAFEDYKNQAIEKQNQDIKILDSAKNNRKKAIKLGNELLGEMKSLRNGKKYTTTNVQQDNYNSDLVLSATATQRIDGKTDTIYGGEIEYRNRNNFISLGLSKSDTDVKNEHSSLERTWTSTDACFGKFARTGKFTWKAGLGLNYEQISTEGYNANSIIEDEDSIVTPYARLGLDYTNGSLSLGFDINQTITTDDTENHSTTVTAKIGVKK